ncbi:hypothetical protein DVH24_018134 [Malus domestica]|uniref:Uncharacterized protein n=1 Tax=Malus domestica TaxID=3750 RepID=A0A498KKE4_MALDO|nr:hypothetical protein DVH24_018134 [Malus domestica]
MQSLYSESSSPTNSVCHITSYAVILDNDTIEQRGPRPLLRRALQRHCSRLFLLYVCNSPRM